MRRRPIEWWERRKLESNGCRSLDWSAVRVCDATDMEAVRDVEFVGAVSLGILRSSEGQVVEHVRLENCMVGDRACIRNIGIALRNCRIGDGARITGTSLVEFEDESTCGIGCEVDVLDETGTRSVRIYPGLSAQAAMLAARETKWKEQCFHPMVESYLDKGFPSPGIGRGAVIEGCGIIRNVNVGEEVEIQGARRLVNGSIINNAAPGRCLAYIGTGVDAENFILEDGRLDSGATIRNCYIGQGASIEKGFSAHDSLFFANCALENGEGCALFAGPYTVSMHKSSLLIACQTSFMNAGSGSNQSNHMYKLGPVHWGVLERGVKTSSDSYIMLGAKIGAFSLVMGQHKTHPDSSQFPFSYLFGDDRGATVVVPAVMLRSCGLLRDEKKWPTRDKRLKRKLPLRDRIVFEVLNPCTVDKMLSAYDVIESLLSRPADDDRYIRYRGMKFSRASLERARHLYALGIFKYLSGKVSEKGIPESTREAGPDEWVDMAGLPMRRTDLREAMQTTDLSSLEASFTKAYDNYQDLEREWIGSRFDSKWRRPADVIADKASEFDRMVEEDRNRYLEELAAQNAMLKL